MEELEFRDKTHFVVGAEGKPGSRLFFIQLGDFATRLHLKLEKEQAVALAGFLEKLLEDMPTEQFQDQPAPLEAFEEPEWAIGEISVGVDVANQQMVVSLTEAIFEETDTKPNQVRVFIDQSQANAFITTASELAAQSRPPCKLCGQPEEYKGHICPRLN